LAWADAWMNRLYGWRGNPLYNSGAIVTLLMVAILLTGIYLLFFYRIGSPYDSVAAIADQAWLGSWIRSLHRYASDAVIVAVAVHAIRVFAQGRTWGPRALAWLSGIGLLGLILVCGWTGYVMVWDLQGLALAREGARLLDAIPIFSEPISRAFVGDREIPRAFFFLNLFLHVALPVGLGLVLWIHVARIARPALLPPRTLSWWLVALLTGVSVAWPVAMFPVADLFTIPDSIPLDLFYSAWLPLTTALPVAAVWSAAIATVGLLLLVPRWAAGSRANLEPSSVNTRVCDACRTCYLDCPYEAISMVPLEGSRAGIVAQVDPQVCVSCGICAGSCAPMGVGPPGRTGRDQLESVQHFIDSRALGPSDLVVIGCTRGTGGITGERAFANSQVFPVECAGTMHTSVVEYLVRAGVGGVLIVSCPPRDCWQREGPKWLEQRLYHGREAELKTRVDRRRIRLVHAGLGERDLVRREVHRFLAEVREMIVPGREQRIESDTTCEPELLQEEVLP